MRNLLSTKEVADYLRLKERKIYDLVAKSQIPHSRVSGKLLFPRALIDDWVKSNLDGGERNAGRGHLALNPRDGPQVIAGSHDPLLDWAVRESRCGLALLSYGTLDGFDRMQAGGACAAAIHMPAAPGHDRNLETARDRLGNHDIVLVEWAKREQGLVVADGNPKRILGIADLQKKSIRVALRQRNAGSYLLFLQLLGEARTNLDALNIVSQPMQTESDIAAAILDGKADAGLAVRAVARQFHLGFVPLVEERLDLAINRRAYFEPPIQTLLGFARSTLFARYAKELSGYDVTQLGRVIWNA